MNKDTIIVEKYKHKYTEANEEEIINEYKCIKGNNETIKNKIRLKKRNYIRLMKNKKTFIKGKKNNLIFTLILFIIIFKLVLTNQNVRKLLPLGNKITMIVEGDGTNRGIFTGSECEPKEVIINNVPMTPTISYELENGNNTIVVSFDEHFKSCNNLFFGLYYIISIDLSEFDASEVTNLSGMFQGCSNLKSINFRHFETAKVVDMENMFYNCESLVSVDLSSIKPDLTTNMRSMFSGCTSLVSIKLFKSETKSLMYFDDMFSNAKSLISLDLSSFDISSIGNMNNVFYGCKSLIYLNLKTFSEKDSVMVSRLFSEDMKDIIYCIDETKSKIIANSIKEISTNNDCENTCFKGIKKLIIEKKICVERCSEDDTFTFEKDGICYKPDSTNIDEETIDETTTIQETEKITPKTQNINNNDDITEKNIIENSDTIKEFSLENFIKNSEQTNTGDINQKDEIIKNIKYNLINGNLDYLLQNVAGGEKQDLLAVDNDLIYQITTTENQKSNEYTNISTINLGECEKTLRDIYKIKDDLSLIILKVDYYMDGLLIPVIGYEVYHPENKSQLDLNYCKDDTIKLNIPVSINEEKEYKHDPKSDYYNDECSAYTTDNGTDILLNDRQNEYITNNYSLCEENCTYSGYEKNTKKAVCECETKPKIMYISEIIREENILSNNFNTSNSTSNIASMKCVDTLFSKDGLLKNIGSYLLLFTFLFYAISVFIYYKCGYQMIQDNIQDITKEKGLNCSQLNLFTNNNRRSKHKQSIRTVNNKIVNKRDKKKKKSKINNPVKKNFKNTNHNRLNKEKDNSSHMSGSKLQIKSIDIMLKLEKKKKKSSLKGLKKLDKNDKKEKKVKVKIDNIKKDQLKDCELNYFNLEKSLKIDKRPFVKYYLSLLFAKHIILFSFYPTNDYNIRIIKMSLFFLSFDIIFAVNTFFFNNSTIHQIYEDGGTYNFSYFIDQIIYSFIISYTTIIFIRYFSLSERILMDLKYEAKTKLIPIKSMEAKKCLNIKYISFYVFCFIIIGFFWFYLSSFCAVFQNSQIYIFLNAFIDFIIICFFPLLYNLLPCILRNMALKNSNKYLFKISKVLQII